MMSAQSVDRHLRRARSFTLTPAQLAALDAEPSHIGKHVLLQRFHQQYAWDTRDLHAFGSMDVAAFSRRWLADEGAFMEEAWSAYLGAEPVEWAELLDAARDYDAEALRQFGEFARLNFPSHDRSQ